MSVLLEIMESSLYMNEYQHNMSDMLSHSLLYTVYTIWKCIYCTFIQQFRLLIFLRAHPTAVPVCLCFTRDMHISRGAQVTFIYYAC